MRLSRNLPLLVLIAAVPAQAADDVTAAADPAPAASGIVAESEGFWEDVHTTEQSEGWRQLQDAVGLERQSRDAVALAAETEVQAVFSVSLDTPDRAADYMSRVGSAGPGGAPLDGAVATALRQRASPEVVQAAVPLVEPEDRGKAAQFQANLSSGIPGLPGLYLGDADQAPAPRASAPSGYAPVSGASSGCGE